jgi:hypothetical protein
MSKQHSGRGCGYIYRLSWRQHLKYTYSFLFIVTKEKQCDCFMDADWTVFDFRVWIRSLTRLLLFKESSTFLRLISCNVVWICN